MLTTIVMLHRALQSNTETASLKQSAPSRHRTLRSPSHPGSDNCAAIILISVDQIVEDGHTVTFSKTQTIITDEEGCYRLRDIRAVFKHSPCLLCILAKKHKEGMA
jgi:hypothetical protein